MFGADALTLYLVFLVFAVGGRIALHYLATGDLGVRTVKRTASNTAKCASILLFTSFVATFVLSLLDATGAIRPQVDLGESTNTFGAAISLAGIALMILSQYQMGTAWRFGVDQAERTELVTGGLYALVRNPIYTGVFLFCIGLLVLLPHVLMLIFLATAWLSIELQVRFVEEPHLRGLHGAVYEKYVEQTGRYFPRFSGKSGR
ncbi:MAG: isoprenylcysteine carboxylmethyltransferase family protein [Nitrospinae bacterium]|nr:isoprenylcysteine carboxylmethyltransferase family protein [Nitrospinota bacterium]